MIYNPQGCKIMLCLHKQFYSMKILRHPSREFGARLFIGNFFPFIKQNKTKDPAMDPKHLINTYLLSLRASVLMSVSAIL